MVKIILVREGFTADMSRNRGPTPLSYAAKGRHEGVVKILLGREEISPDKPDNDDRAPLSYAAGGRCDIFSSSRVGDMFHSGGNEISLGRGGGDVEPGGGGRIPLTYAAASRCEEVMKILLGREEANSDKPENGCLSPLTYATGGGHGGVIKILPGREEVNLDRPDNGYLLPLLYAPGSTHKILHSGVLDEVVKMFTRTGRGQSRQAG